MFNAHVPITWVLYPFAFASSISTPVTANVAVVLGLEPPDKLTKLIKLPTKKPKFMTTSIPSSTTFLPAPTALRAAARIDFQGFKRNVMDALEQAGFATAAHTLACDTWPIAVWPDLVELSCQGVRQAIMALDLLVTLLELYEVSFEWDAIEGRVVVVGKDVGRKMNAPPSLLRQLRAQLDEEKRTW
jgi:hypothetical protein